jgi:hypothetical protein
LALFAAGRVSSSGDGGVAAALQILGNGIIENLRCRGVVLVGKIAPDVVVIDRGGGGVVVHLEISAHDISRAPRRPDLPTTVQKKGSS